MLKTPFSIFLFAVLAFTFSFAVSQAEAAEPKPEIPFLEAWSNSPHADAKSESFRHWDKDGKIPKNCAACHSSDGFRDFLGADGSAKNSVDAEHDVHSVVDCVACHNKATLALNSVTFPSGVVISDTGASSTCMACHQGRQAGANVDAAVKGFAEDRPSDKLKFLNVHYRAAAATLWGTLAKGGYEYSGMIYKGLFGHAIDSKNKNKTSNMNECVQCHKPHSLEVRVDSCKTCHKSVTDAKSLPGIRMSKIDFDGDGNTSEGIQGEIVTMQERLMQTMQVYAKRVAKKTIAYHSHNYPYFFYDTNKNGAADDAEAVYKNQYKSWTPRLLKAAYNYQFATKDPGAYTHNPGYVLQLLHDSLNDLAGKTKTKMDGMKRPN